MVKIDAPDIGYGGILKQRMHDKEKLVWYHYGIWLGPQQNYSTINKEILSVVICISKFQDDLFYKKLLRINCKSVKDVLQKDVKNFVSEQIFARWQAIVSSFDFEIEFIKGENNSLPDFLAIEVFTRNEWQNIFCTGFHNEQKGQRQRYTKGQWLQNCSYKKFIPISCQFSTFTI